MNKPNPAAGNVLFLILIAVALFAALSYVVTQSSRTGSGNVSDEKMRLVASQLVQNGVGLRTTILRMIMQGHKPEELDPWWDGSPHAIFGQAGGGTRIEVPKLENFGIQGDGNFYYHAPAAGPQIAITDIGTSDPEILMALNFTISPQSEQLCKIINKQLGINGIPGTSPLMNWNLAAPGQPVACVRNYNDFYMYYFVFYER